MVGGLSGERGKDETRGRMFGVKQPPATSLTRSRAVEDAPQRPVSSEPFRGAGWFC